MTIISEKEFRILEIAGYCFDLDLLDPMAGLSDCREMRHFKSFTAGAGFLFPRSDPPWAPGGTMLRS